MSNCAPVLVVEGVELVEVGEAPGDVVGPALLFLPPQPATPNTTTTAESVRTTARILRLPRYLADAIGHAEFAAAVPHNRLAALVEHRLVRAVDDDVVHDVVGDDGVARAHHGHRPAGAQRVDGVPGAVDQQRGPVAVDCLLDSF